MEIRVLSYGVEVEVYRLLQFLNQDIRKTALLHVQRLTKPKI